MAFLVVDSDSALLTTVITTIIRQLITLQSGLAHHQAHMVQTLIHGGMVQW